MLKKIRSHHSFMLAHTRAITRTFTRPTLVYLFFISSTLILVCAGGFYWLEQGVNPKLDGFLDALYFSISTMTSVGFGDIVPVTKLGKCLTILMMLLGTAIYVSFTATIAAYFLETDAQREE